MFLQVIISVISVGLILIIGDIIAVNRKDWSFNSEYVSGIKIFNLPIEIMFFFLVVPYSIIFIYEWMKYFVKDRAYKLNFLILIIIVIALLLSGLILHTIYYTSTVFLFCGFLILLIGLSSDDLIISKVTIVTVLISYIFLLIVSYILTSLPIVIYNQNSILNIRVTSIPIENFVYLISLISGSLFIYNKFSRFLKRISKNK